jgi:hypothetical protein
MLSRLSDVCFVGKRRVISRAGFTDPQDIVDAILSADAQRVAGD